MSASAMHRVLVYGPREHPTLMLVLLNVADWPDTDLDERGHAVSQRVVAERVGVSFWKCQKLMDEAVSDGWLTVVQARAERHRGLWKLGPEFANLRGYRAACAIRVLSVAQQLRDSERQIATDVDVVDVSTPPTPEGWGVGDVTDSDVPPAAAEPVDTGASVEDSRAQLRALVEPLRTVPRGLRHLDEQELDEAVSNHPANRRESP